MFVEGGTIQVLPGTAIGFREDYVPDQGAEQAWPWWWTLEGFELWEGSSFISHGTPSAPVIFADVQVVQEGAPLEFQGGLHTGFLAEVFGGGWVATGVFGAAEEGGPVPAKQTFKRLSVTGLGVLDQRCVVD